LNPALRSLREAFGDKVAATREETGIAEQFCVSERAVRARTR
jgi:hypothetical protein